jgi:hypothetical protein
MHSERIPCLVTKYPFYLTFDKFLIMELLVPYIVGVNPNSPSNPHSAMASGGYDLDKIDSDPPQEVHVLYGAVVGGPDKRDNFYDIRSDWPQTEVLKKIPYYPQFLYNLV